MEFLWTSSPMCTLVVMVCPGYLLMDPSSTFRIGPAQGRVQPTKTPGYVF